MSSILDLFLTFAKVGLFTFGGGYAMIALIQDTLGHRDISTTMNIYADVTNELRQSEFKGLDSFFKTGRRNVEDDN